MRILVAEDDKNISEIISLSIKELDSSLDVIVFEEAKNALKYAKNNTVDIFILDIQLKDYKGTHLAKQIREIDEYKYSPLVFVTALAGEELLAYRELKCYNFLIKPFTKEEINTVLNEVINYQQQLKPISKTIRIEQKSFIFEYDLENIIYIESFGKKLELHLFNDNKKTSEMISGYSLKSILELINDCNFIQCHKSFILNKSFIEKIDKANNLIFLKNNTGKIPIGKKFLNGIY